MTDATTNEVLEAALAYAAAGVPILPCEPSTKEPVGTLVPPNRDPQGRGYAAGTGGFKKATKDPELIKEWWAMRPDAMAGIPTGAASGVFVIDLDAPKQVKRGKLGELTPSGIENWDRIGIEYKTYEVETAGGGLHVYFKYDPERPVTNKEGGLKGKGINVRGNGGYVIIPPSRAMNGGQYRPVNGLAVGDAAEAPEALYALLGARQPVARKAAKQADAEASDKATSDPPDEPSGDYQRTPDNVGLVRGALPALCPDDRNETWVEVGMALESLTPDWGEDYPKAIFAWWSQKFDTRGVFDPIVLDRQWVSFKDGRLARKNGESIGIGRLFWLARKAGWSDPRHYREQSGQLPAGVNLADFVAYARAHSFIFMPDGQPWPAETINARLPWAEYVDAKGKTKRLSPAMWLHQNKPVEQVTWAPGRPPIIQNRLILEGGFVQRDRVAIFNFYKPPAIEDGDSSQATRWLEHVHKVFQSDAGHIIAWCAFRVQHPEVKINHAIVLGGEQGIGKDTCLEPVKYAVGHWNFAEVKPTQIMNRFNPCLKSVILRINEARDLGDVDRYKFYEHLKDYIAAPPDVLRVDEKNLREYVIANCTGLVITTNHKHGGLYLPPDDRRYFVAWSDLDKTAFDDAYWRGIYGWYERDGNRHVAVYLRELDVSSFDPKAPPPRTPAWQAIVGSNASPEEAELSDVMDELGNPDAVLLWQVIGKASGGIFDWLTDRKNRRVIPIHMEKAGYALVANPTARDGVWKIDGRRQPVYAKKTLSYQARLLAIRKIDKG